MTTLILPTSTTLGMTLFLLAFSSTFFPTTSICSHSMASALSSSGFSLFANALLVNQISTSSPRTYLAPSDTSLLNRRLDNKTLQSHVSTAAGAMSYQTLLTLPHNSFLQTLDHNTTLVVGTYSGNRVSFNDVLVVVPNLYVDETCAVHGVYGPLVPISSDQKDVSRPKKEVKRSPMEVVKRRRANQLAAYGRFIRRRHGPSGLHKINPSSRP
ncbi:hypothetical protein ACFE04_020191 [Oxalis oulophora]